MRVNCILNQFCRTMMGFCQELVLFLNKSREQSTDRASMQVVWVSTSGECWWIGYFSLVHLLALIDSDFSSDPSQLKGNEQGRGVQGSKNFGKKMMDTNPPAVLFIGIPQRSNVKSERACSHFVNTLIKIRTNTRRLIFPHNKAVCLTSRRWSLDASTLHSKYRITLKKKETNLLPGSLFKLIQVFTIAVSELCPKPQ